MWLILQEHSIIYTRPRKSFNEIVSNLIKMLEILKLLVGIFCKYLVKSFQQVPLGKLLLLLYLCLFKIQLTLSISNTNIFFSLYLLSRANSLVPCKFEIERVNCTTKTWITPNQILDKNSSDKSIYGTKLTKCLI